MERSFGYNITTYGCQMNEHDSLVMAELLNAVGGYPASVTEADVLIYNTCCVREHAEDRVFGNVGAIQKRLGEKPGLIVGVTGCMMQQKGVAERFMKRFPFVSFTCGTHSLHTLPLILQRAFAGERVLDPSSDDTLVEGLPVPLGAISSYVNIMYGCDNYCTYCIVPFVRGHERSRDMKDIIDEITRLAKSGTREVTLLGQNVNSYGGGGAAFAELLRAVNDIDGIERIRFMTSHPKDISEELMLAMAECGKVAKQLHLPLQSGSDEILRRMNRRYTAEQYLEKAARLRSFMPGIALSTDIIVGFPGETEEDFSKTLEIAARADYVTGYFFKYSPREGTAAAKFNDQIPEEVKSERLARLLAQQNAATEVYNAKLLGETLSVLAEKAADRYQGELIGRSDSGRTVHFAAGSEYIGRICDVTVTGVTGNTISAKMNAR